MTLDKSTRAEGSNFVDLLIYCRLFSKSFDQLPLNKIKKWTLSENGLETTTCHTLELFAKPQAGDILSFIDLSVKVSSLYFY